MELLGAFIGGFLGVVGAFAGVWLANRYDREKQEREIRKSISLQLYTEYQSPEMLKARILAREVFDRIREEEKSLILSEIWETADFDESHSISLLIVFLEKLGVYFNTNHLDKELAKQLVGRDFSYWYQNYISELIKTSDKGQSDWARHIIQANEWITS